MTKEELENQAYMNSFTAPGIRASEDFIFDPNSYAHLYDKVMDNFKLMAFPPRNPFFVNDYEEQSFNFGLDPKNQRLNIKPKEDHFSQESDTSKTYNNFYDPVLYKGVALYKDPGEKLLTKKDIYNSSIQGENTFDSLQRMYDFYEKDVYPRKKENSTRFNELQHNINKLKKTPIYIVPEEIKPKYNGWVYNHEHANITPMHIKHINNTSDLVHEGSHSEDRNIDRGKSISESIDSLEQIYLKDAYDSPIQDSWASYLDEAKATNRELRYQISEMSGLTGKNLTDYIKNMPDDFLRIMYNGVNGYVGKEFYKINPKDSEKLQKLKKALIKVAYNGKKDFTTFAKRGTKLVKKSKFQ